MKHLFACITKLLAPLPTSATGAATAATAQSPLLLLLYLLVGYDDAGDDDAKLKPYSTHTDAKAPLHPTLLRSRGVLCLNPCVPHVMSCSACVARCSVPKSVVPDPEAPAGDAAHTIESAHPHACCTAPLQQLGRLFAGTRDSFRVYAPCDLTVSRDGVAPSDAKV